MRDPRPCPAFTLVELMVSMAILSLLAIFLLRAVEGTTGVWRYSTAKAESFRSARDAFESMTRRLSQATLNTYWDYEYTMTGGIPTPSKYVRQSDLRFICGSSQTLAGTLNPPPPTHAIFFQAPLGDVDDVNFEGMGNLMNTCGYYVEYKPDSLDRPPFLNLVSPALPTRSRYRLMEVRQPSNRFGLYQRTSVLTYTGKEWIREVVAPAPPATAPVRVLAENVIALIILPKLAATEDQTGVKLAPTYEYDSATTKADPAVSPKNQLPPLVQVTLVALDETTAVRLAQVTRPFGAPPDFGLANLFVVGRAGSAAKYGDDFRTLIDTLNSRRLSHRVFSTTVPIRGAKWSRD